MALYLDKNTGRYVTAHEHFGYKTIHSPEKRAFLEDTPTLLGVRQFEYELLSTEAQLAVDELFVESTELDYEDGYRYWVGIDFGKLLDYRERILNEDGTPKYDPYPTAEQLAFAIVRYTEDSDPYALEEERYPHEDDDDTRCRLASDIFQELCDGDARSKLLEDLLVDLTDLTVIPPAERPESKALRDGLYSRLSDIIRALNRFDSRRIGFELPSMQVRPAQESAAPAQANADELMASAVELAASMAKPTNEPRGVRQ